MVVTGRTLSSMEEEWDGEERRETSRRVPPDRRIVERRKKYALNIILPTIVAIMGGGLISWGAYVTHVTYSISAKFDSSYAAHVANQDKHDQEDKDERMAMRIDYNSKILKLRGAMDDGFKEFRDSNRSIYNLLVSRTFGRGHIEQDSGDDEQ